MLKRLIFGIGLVIVLSPPLRAQINLSANPPQIVPNPACTNGQVITYNTTSGKWDTCATNGGASGITGSGTSGQVSYFTGANSISSEASFTYDPVTNSLSITTTTAATTFTNIIPTDAGFNEEYGNIAYHATKKWGVWIGDDGSYHLDSADAFGWYITTAGNVTFLHDITGTVVNVGSSTGVKHSAASGVETVLGLSGQAESLLYDYAGTANTVGVSTGTGVTKIDYGNIITEGKFNSSDGSVGATGTCLALPVVKDGLVISCGI